jgi:hypothetical protein
VRRWLEAHRQDVIDVTQALQQAVRVVWPDARDEDGILQRCLGHIAEFVVRYDLQAGASMKKLADLALLFSDRQNPTDCDPVWAEFAFKDVLNEDAQAVVQLAALTGSHIDQILAQVFEIDMLRQLLAEYLCLLQEPGIFVRVIPCPGEIDDHRVRLGKVAAGVS